MARLTNLLIVVLLVLGAVPAVMATRRKPKRRPVEPDDGGDRGAAAPGAADATSQNASYLYCNDTVTASGSSTAAGSGALPEAGSGCSGGPAAMQGAPTVVELTWQTADTRLTLQTDSPAMVEAAEWSAAVSRDPPPARPDRSSAAAQVADRVAGLLLVLENEASPAVAHAIENILQPLVTAHGDAVLCDLIEGIMQAMSRRGISEHRQRHMVALLMFSLADPTAPMHMASACPGSHVLSPTLRPRSSCAIFSCVRSHLMSTTEPAMESQGPSCRCDRALFVFRCCQGRWCIHACFTDRCPQLAAHAKCGHQQDMRGVCVMQHGWPVSRWVLHAHRPPHVLIGIQSRPSREGVARPRRARQATIHGARLFLCVECADCNSLSAIRSMRPHTSVSVTHSRMALPPWSLPHIPCRVMGVRPATPDGRTSLFSICHARPVSSCEKTNFSGSWTCSVNPELFALLSGIRFWEFDGARASGARHSSDRMYDCLSRLAQVSLGVAVSFGLPSLGANSSNCSQPLLFTSVGSYGVLLHRLQGLSHPLMPHLHLCSVSARGPQLQLRQLGVPRVPGLAHHYSSCSQDWSRRPSIWFAGGLSSACSMRLGVDSFLRLLLSDAVVIGFSYSTITSCHPRIVGLCSVLVDVTCTPPSHARHPGRRCYRASWMVAATQGPFHHVADLADTQAIMGPCQVTAVVPPPTCWATCTLHRIVPFPATMLCTCRPSQLPYPAACRYGSGREDAPGYPCPGFSAAHYTISVHPPQAWGLSLSLFSWGPRAMGRGGHRGRRPHKSPASIARSKLRPGKRERQALRHGAADEVDIAATSGAISSASGSVAATPSPTATAASSHTYVAPSTGAAVTTAPKAIAAPMTATSSSRMDLTSPLAPPGSAFSLLTRPKSKAAPALPPSRANASGALPRAPAPPEPSLPEAASAATTSAAVTAEASMPLPDEPASLPVHGPFLRPKSAAPSASSILTATATSHVDVVNTDMDDSAHMASPVEPLPAASPESTSSIDTEASCSLQLQMEVIHDFWRDRADTTVTSPDESLQVLAAEAPVEPPTLPPLDGATTGGLVPALGADGVTAPSISPLPPLRSLCRRHLRTRLLLRPMRLFQWLRGLSHASHICEHGWRLVQHVADWQNVLPWSAALRHLLLI